MASRPSCRPVLLPLLLALPLGLAGCGGVDAARVLEVTPATHDFGRVRHGRRQRAAFRIVNRSDRELGIIPRPNCACFKIVPPQPKTVLQPGTETNLHLELDTRVLPSKPQVLAGKALVMVVKGHPELSQVRVPLEAEVYRPLEIKPHHLRMGSITGKPADFAAQTVRFEPLEGGRATIADVKVQPADLFEVTWQSDGDVAVMAVRLLESARRTRGPIGANFDVKVTLTDADGQEETLPVRVLLDGFWDRR